jgi:hypothetical protein
MDLGKFAEKDPRAMAGGCGCLLAVVVGVLLMCNRSCAASREERHAEAMERTRKHDRSQELAAQESERQARMKAEIDKREQEARAEELARIGVQLATLKPAERVVRLRKCAADSDQCPDGNWPTLLFQAAATPSERKRLDALWDQLKAREKQIEAQAEKSRQRAAAAERRANAPLQCCDGSLSPSCTCGNPRRGCCSRHGGVCGCSE